MKISFAAAFFLFAALSLSALTVSAQSAKCSLRLKIKDDATEKALTGASSIATDKTSGESIDAVSREDELLFEGLIQSNIYSISFSREGYKRTLVESYTPYCTGKANNVININAYMQKGDVNDVYLAGTTVKLRHQGVVNDRAIHLEIPPYPPTARSAGASGPAYVEIVIDEQGKVIDAVMTRGHLFLRSVTLRAARASTFKPVVVDGKAIKVRATIIYNFQ